MLQDGTYRYTKTTAWAGEEITATVRGGAVTDWARNGLSVTVWGIDPAPYTAELLTEIAERRRLGSLVRPVEFEPAGPIGKREARTLHVELAHLGFRDHYAAASDALGHPVTSLAALSTAEARTVYSYAYGQWGRA